MTRDQLEAWRGYLVEQMQERFGIENQEAQKAVMNWLRSMAYPIPKMGRIRSQRYGLPVRRQANGTRSARA
jgi:hypothetical protein